MIFHVYLKYVQMLPQQQEPLAYKASENEKNTAENYSALLLSTQPLCLQLT